MVEQPGRLQSVFHSLEIDPLLHERSELKAYNSGLAWAENVQAFPQGGFRNRNGLRDVGALPADATRLFGFDASTGSSYNVVLRNGAADMWSASALLQSVSITGLTSAMLPELTVAQQLDTMLIFHVDLQTKRLKHAGPTSWSVDIAPWEEVPNWDYGGTYTNGVAAEWTLEFVGPEDDTTVFTLSVSNQRTLTILYDATMANTVSRIQAALLALPNISPGIVVQDATAGPGTGGKVRITFSGAGNEGDGWAVSGTVTNKSDAAILANKTVVGVAPGEPVWSAARGWPQCGCFSGNQRLLVGGFKSLPTAWMFSRLADYYNFDLRFTGPDGPALVPMAGAGGEKIEHIVDSLNILIMTNKGEYWLENRALSSAETPNHVTASTNGTKRGVPVVESEGAAIFSHLEGGVLSEMRYTDVQGNFTTLPISLFGSHLVNDTKDLALRRQRRSTDGNQLFTINSDGSARLTTMLRDQEVMGFARLTSGDGIFHAVAVNGTNVPSWIVQRPSGKRLERSEEGLLLDEAVSGVFEVPSAIISGLSRFNGRQVWCLGDGHVLGPVDVIEGGVTLPLAVTNWTVGSWAPPKVVTLPLSRAVGPGIVLKRKARIHSVTISLQDTTSIAISTNGKPLKDIDLRRWGMLADVPELDQGFTGEIRITGLMGFAKAPYLTISQLRPGRLEVRSITPEAKL